MARWTAKIPGGFIDLIRRLGISLPPGTDVPFELTGNVLPVAIVDPSPLTITTVDFTLSIPASAGELVAPAANAVLADTGPVAFGDYNFLVMANTDETGGRNLRLQRRDAANAANIWSQYFSSGGGGCPGAFYRGRVHLDANERLRVIVGTNGFTGGVNAQAGIWLSL